MVLYTGIRFKFSGIAAASIRASGTFTGLESWHGTRHGTGQFKIAEMTDLSNFVSTPDQAHEAIVCLKEAIAGTMP